MVKKDFLGVEFYQFTIQSDDASVNEVISIKKSLVDEIKECVDFLNDVSDDNIKKYALKFFIELALISGVDFVKNNKKSIIESLVDENFVSYTQFIYEYVIGNAEKVVD